MLEFILENYEIILAAIVIIVAIISHVFKIYKNKIIAFIFAAEEKFGPGKGYEKLQEAAQSAEKSFPPIVKKILGNGAYEIIVQNAFDEIKDIIEQEKSKYN